MPNIDNSWKIRVLLLVTLLLVLIDGQGCGSSRNFTVRNALVNFSFEYPASYYRPSVDRSQEDSIKVFASYRSEGRQPPDAYIGIRVSKTKYAYDGADRLYQTGGDYDTTGGYYGRLWNLRTADGDGPAYLTGWANRVAVTLDHTKIDSSLAHFPVLLHLGPECGTSGADMSAAFTEVGANSRKIAVTGSDGQTQLYVEIERWDRNGT